MKVSVELMKYYSDDAQWQLPLRELVAKIGSQLGAVEGAIELRPKYEGIKIVEISEAKPVISICIDKKQVVRPFGLIYTHVKTRLVSLDYREICLKDHIAQRQSRRFGITNHEL